MRTNSLACLLCLLTLSACGGGGGSGNTTNTATGTTTGTATGTTTGTSNVVVKAKVSGKVIDLQGAPIAGVSINVFHHNENATVKTTTDANGMWSVSGLSTMNNADYAIYAETSGVGAFPTVTDPAGKVTKFDFNGLYRTVVRFSTMPNHDVANLNFTVLRHGDKITSLSRTGQTVSYAAGDDGGVKKGVAWPSARFTDNQDGTVTDRVSNLIWLKNAGCFTPAIWSSALASANQLASGQCGLSDASKAGDWRMPNINELESMVDVSQSKPAISAGAPFTNLVQDTAYWSSTTYTAASSNAMAIRFNDGRWINGVENGETNFNNEKANAKNGLWAVKAKVSGATQLLATGVFTGPGGTSFGTADDASLQMGVSLTYPRFADKGDGTVADTVTGLIWLKQADCFNQTWDAALTSIGKLASGQCGLSDGSSAGQWRMPNRTEMLSISDRAPTFPQAAYFVGQYHGNGSVTGPVIFNQFVNAVYYWTSTTNSSDSTQAWTIYSCDIGVYNQAKTNTRYSLAVR